MSMTLIAAVDNNYGIGYQGQLLWHLPADMAFFRKMTMGHTIVMGRKTYDSIGKPLKDRENIVLTTQKLQIPSVTVIHDIKELVKEQKEIMIIGGAQIYELCLPLANRILLTEVDANLQADTFFPKIDKKQFQCIQEDRYPADEKNIYDMVFKEYIKI